MYSFETNISLNTSTNFGFSFDWKVHKISINKILPSILEFLGRWTITMTHRICVIVYYEINQSKVNTKYLKYYFLWYEQLL